ncbi:MAG: M48 family metallopeptidase [Alphaproteobacteria bacterium]
MKKQPFTIFERKNNPQIWQMMHGLCQKYGAEVPTMLVAEDSNFYPVDKIQGVVVFPKVYCDFKNPSTIEFICASVLQEIYGFMPNELIPHTQEGKVAIFEQRLGCSIVPFQQEIYPELYDLLQRVGNNTCFSMPDLFIADMPNVKNAFADLDHQAIIFTQELLCDPFFSLENKQGIGLHEMGHFACDMDKYRADFLRSTANSLFQGSIFMVMGVGVLALYNATQPTQTAYPSGAFVLLGSFSAMFSMLGTLTKLSAFSCLRNSERLANRFASAQSPDINDSMVQLFSMYEKMQQAQGFRNVSQQTNSLWTMVERISSQCSQLFNTHPAMAERREIYKTARPVEIQRKL